MLKVSKKAGFAGLWMILVIMLFSGGLSIKIQASEDSQKESDEDSQNASIVVTREDFIQGVVDASGDLADLEIQKSELVNTYKQLKSSVSALKKVYRYLDDYKSAYNKYNKTWDNASSSYKTYIKLSYKVAMGTASEEEVLKLQTMTDTTLSPDTAAEIAADSQENYIDVEGYAEYETYEPIFDALGIDDPNLSDDEIYTIFIEPAYITPIEVQMNITYLERNIAIAQASLEKNAGVLFDSLRMLEAYDTLATQNYTRLLSTYNGDVLSNSLGKISDIDLETSKNDMMTAKLDMNTSKRQEDSLRMQMNVLLHRQPTADLEIQAQETFTFENLDPLEDYIAKALEQRNEIVTNQEETSSKQSELNYIEEYTDDSEPRYEVAATELTQLETDYDRIQNEITIEVNKAYNQVLKAQDKVTDQEAILEEAEEQYENVSTQEELGFATRNQVRQVRLLVTQNEEALISARGDYLDAMSDLTAVSGVGPAYTGQ